MPEAKSYRLMVIYTQLQKGGILSKTALAQEFGVSERSIQRDMESLRCFLAEQAMPQEIILDRQAGGYRLITRSPFIMSNAEILTVCKILLESRSLCRDEMLPILDKLIDCCVPQASQDLVKQLVANEKLLYIEPHHGQLLVETLWELGQAIQRKRILEIRYQKLKGREVVKRIVEPVGLMFSEYYFYLVAFIRDIDRQEAFENPDDLFPTIYRVDRLKSFRETGETFSPPYAQRFQEGEFRKRVQFMYGGRLQTARFTYSGPSIEAVLDRLPTAEILSEKDGVYTVSAEVFGKGIEMWLRSQGEYIELVLHK
ncbi:MAG: WYL domain-containing protein [Oscillibacter sp.]|nr:WYL domain-containing protein [Oscillibacter sp.]